VQRFHDAGEVAAEGRARIRLGRVQLARGDVRAAEGIAGEAQAVVRGSGSALMQAEAAVLLGQIAEAAGARQAALSHYDRAVASYPAGDRSRGVATALHHRGLALSSLGEQAGALESLERARAIRHGMGLRDAEAETLFHVARIEWQAGGLGRAQAHLRDALALIEDVRGRVAGEYSRITYFAARQRYFSAYIDLLMQLHAQTGARGFAEEAFLASERAHARSLVDLIGESRSDIRRGVDPALLALERELQRELDFWSYRLAALMDRGQDQEASRVRETLGALVARYRETEARIRSASASIAALIAPPTLSVDQVRRDLLDDETAMLRFVLGDQRSHVWVITARGLTVRTLPPRAHVERLARRVYELVSAKRRPPGDAGLLAQYQAAAADLSAMILGPIDADLEARRLLVVSDGFLQLVPLAALPAPGTGAPMIVRHEIVTLPSASLLAVLRREASRRPAPSRTLFVVADPVYEATDPRVARAGTPAPADRSGASDDRARPPAFTRLPFSLLEARSILGLVPAALRGEALGFAANRAAATAPDLREYRIVHFATHATSDASHPELSGIVLSLVGPDGTPQNGLLRLREIYSGVSLGADLVVLSACETAVGQDIPGEGMMGVARAVFAAGGISVIASLYKVEDERSAELMQNFYRRLLGPQGSGAAAALRAAQVQMLSDPQWQDPYWWSGFVLMGDPDSMNTSDRRLSRRR
jgi:CHAT domain-containing protein